MFLLITGTPGCGADQVRRFLREKNREYVNLIPRLSDLTPCDERVRFSGGIVYPVNLFCDLLNAHMRIAQDRIMLRDRASDHLLAFSLWEYLEVGYVEAAELADREFFQALYDDLRDGLPAPDAVLDLRTDYLKAATWAGLNGNTLTHADFDRRMERLGRFLDRLQVPVETLTMEEAEVDVFLENVGDLFESFRTTYNGPKTIWKNRLFRLGE